MLQLSICRKGRSCTEGTMQFLCSATCAMTCFDLSQIGHQNEVGQELCKSVFQSFPAIAVAQHVSQESASGHFWTKARTKESVVLSQASGHHSAILETHSHTAWRSCEKTHLEIFGTRWYEYCMFVLFANHQRAGKNGLRAKPIVGQVLRKQ